MVPSQFTKLAPIVEITPPFGSGARFGMCDQARPASVQLLCQPLMPRTVKRLGPWLELATVSASVAERILRAHETWFTSRSTAAAKAVKRLGPRLKLATVGDSVVGKILQAQEHEAQRTSCDIGAAEVVTQAWPEPKVITMSDTKAVRSVLIRMSHQCRMSAVIECR